MSFFSLYNNFKIFCKEKTHDLYIWGNGTSDHTSDYSNLCPHKIEKFYDIEGNDITDKFKRIKTVEFGNYFTAVINEDGELFIWITPFVSGDGQSPIN